MEAIWVNITLITKQHGSTPQHAFFDIWLQAVGSPKVNGTAEQFFKVILQSEQAKIPNGAVEFYEQIHVTGGSGFIPRHRTKKLQGFHTEFS